MTESGNTSALCSLAVLDKESIMADKKQPETINRGPTGEQRLEDNYVEEFDIDGDVKRKGEDPSPADRERGETSSAERPAPIDR
jgi:hypothetical protein